MVPNVRSKMNLSVLNVDFRHRRGCRAALEGLRWPEGVRCLRCGSDRFPHLDAETTRIAMPARYRFSSQRAPSFTTPTALAEWFLAIL